MREKGNPSLQRSNCWVKLVVTFIMISKFHVSHVPLIADYVLVFQFHCIALIKNYRLNANLIVSTWWL